MKLNLAAFNWQHGLIWAATAVGGAAATLAAKASDLCASSVDVAACVSHTTSVCATIGSVCGMVIFVLAHTSASLLQKDEKSQ